MKTLYYSHADFLEHETGEGHPESADRLRCIADALDAPEFADLIRLPAPLATEEHVRLIHPLFHIEAVRAATPAEGEYFLDHDTVLSPGSEIAAFRAVGAVCDAVDRILAGQADNAFCAIRPPGHHAEPDLAMGFCLFNNVAIAAEYARLYYHVERIAIVDFDVHHGNGTQAAFYNQPAVLYASTHEMPNYPGTGFPAENGVGNIINVPLAEGETSNRFRQKYSSIILPALRNFKPNLLIISAGFDAHKDDPFATTLLDEEDYRWLTQELMAVAATYCKGRLISALEGGYNLTALAACVAVHVKTLMGDHPPS
ncbi:MAG: histone deacetylase family protein [Methylococcales bacterium]|nr:histone deacetylase family protein [Methylococcales bacterium]